MGIDVGDASSAHYAHLLTIAGVEAWLDARALAHEDRQVVIALLEVRIEPFYIFPVKERCFSKLYNLKMKMTISPDSLGSVSFGIQNDSQLLQFWCKAGQPEQSNTHFGTTFAILKCSGSKSI